MTVKENLANNIVTVQTATDALESIEGLLKQAKAVAESAKASSSVAERTTFSAQYDGILDQINNTSADATFNGVGLLKATPDSLTVKLNETTTTLTVAGIASDQVGLAVTDAGDWENATIATGTTAIDVDIAKIDAALSTVRTSAKTLGTNAALIQSREEFTANMINSLKEGAGNLVNADLNEESANLLALQTRQALANNSLSLAVQSEQAILSLFR